MGYILYYEFIISKYGLITLLWMKNSEAKGVIARPNLCLLLLALARDADQSHLPAPTQTIQSLLLPSRRGSETVGKNQCLVTQYWYFTTRIPIQGFLNLTNLVSTFSKFGYLIRGLVAKLKDPVPNG